MASFVGLPPNRRLCGSLLAWRYRPVHSHSRRAGPAPPRGHRAHRQPTRRRVSRRYAVSTVSAGRICRFGRCRRGIGRRARLVAPQVLIVSMALENFRLAIRQTARIRSPQQARTYGRPLRRGFEDICEAYARARTTDDERLAIARSASRGSKITTLLICRL